MSHDNRFTPFAAQCLGAFLILMLSATGAARAQSAYDSDRNPSLQLIPSLGVTRSTDTNAGDARGFGGLAVRVPLMTYLKVEAGVSYRQDSYAGGALKVRQWPTTASLWVSPMPALYLGGGVGWYHTTLAFSGSTGIANRTSDKAGVHIGGGLDVPVAPRLSLDLNGRYVFMTKDKASFDVPTTFNPDYWTTSLGLAIAF